MKDCLANECSSSPVFGSDQPVRAGMLPFNNGTVYEGDFVQGKRTGYGILRFSTGTIQEGAWQDNEYLR